MWTDHAFVQTLRLEQSIQSGWNTSDTETMSSKRKSLQNVKHGDSAICHIAKLKDADWPCFFANSWAWGNRDLFLAAHVTSSAPGTRLNASMKSSAIRPVPAKPHLKGWKTANTHLLSPRGKKCASASNALPTWTSTAKLCWRDAWCTGCCLWRFIHFLTTSASKALPTCSISTTPLLSQLIEWWTRANNEAHRKMQM